MNPQLAAAVFALSVAQLQRIQEIKSKSEADINAVINDGNFVMTPVATPSAGSSAAGAAPAAVATASPKKRKMSPAAIERIRAAQAKRWARVRRENKAKGKGKTASTGQRNLSPAARKRIGAASKARWAARRNAKAQAQQPSATPTVNASQVAA
jgi:hypothetical protein